MSNFKGSYLRVLTPITSDGTIPIMDESGQAQYKESHLPTTALKLMEKKNTKLPLHLRHRIELVGGVGSSDVKQKKAKNG